MWRLDQSINQLWHFKVFIVLIAISLTFPISDPWFLGRWVTSLRPFQPTGGQTSTTWWVFIRLWCIEDKSRIIFFITFHPTSTLRILMLCCCSVFGFSRRCCKTPLWNRCSAMSWTSGIFLFSVAFLNFWRKIFQPAMIVLNNRYFCWSLELPSLSLQLFMCHFAQF